MPGPHHATKGLRNLAVCPILQDMKDQHNYSWLAALSLLCCLPSFAATVYKSIDENGVVSYSDTRPAEDIVVETLVIDDQAPSTTEQAQQRLQDMRETTDRMVADRMAREKHRAELRQLEAQTNAQQPSQDVPDYYDSSPIYTGNYGFPAQRPWRPSHHPRPEHPIAHPPLRPPGIQPLPDYDYPGSLIRRRYDPKVRAALR